MSRFQQQISCGLILLSITLLTACGQLNRLPDQTPDSASSDDTSFHSDITFQSDTSFPYMGGTGDLGLVIERTRGSVLIVNTSSQQAIRRIEGLGDLSHASVVYSRDQRYGFVFGRDGGLTKVDLLQGEIASRIIQAGNSIGGAISQDGRYVAVSNYEPGGVRIFRSDDLSLVADIPATELPETTISTNNQPVRRHSKTVGLVDLPSNRFAVSLFDSHEIWLIEMTDTDPQTQGIQPQVTKYTGVGRQPYDALVTPEGRYYIAGLFGDQGMAKLDLWEPERGIQRIMPTYGLKEKRLPVYKMPHLEGWTQAGPYLFAPGVGHHEVIVIDTRSWEIIKRIPTHSQPVFVMAQPDARRIWVNFAHPHNNILQVIDTKELQIINTIDAGKTVLHMEFTPRGDQLWVSLRDENRIVIFDPYRMLPIASVAAQAPSGIFFTSRAHRLGL
ncbi:cytochrome D1 domain-containing protein [Hahella ganghwensis]|uniref:cytochrome D1 domain-containing protein n=1 Tax=Hahella ganghwensis TaxID=286420 RepID=UPI00036F8403|nr:cytochrome D1 domain-containing protein [Hahella ganghwensis]